MTDPTSSSTAGRRPSGRISRRDFLRIVAGAGIAGWVGGSILENLEADRVVRETRKLMGTVVNLTLIAPDRKSAATAREAAAACLDCMAGLEALLSRFQAGSQVSMLNRSGSLSSPHPALLDLIRQSRRVSELSGGQFDITILPALALYQQRQAQGGGLPSSAEIEAACRKVDYRKLAADERAIVFAEPGMGITLDGIAKGYIVDEGVSRLVERGFCDVLVEAGGDLVASGQPGAGRPWKIGIQSPRPAGEPLVTKLDALNEAVATSGDNLQPFTADYSVHHILNPHTGRSSTALASATVIAPRLALADALATALMLMDPAQGLELVKGLGLRAVLVTKDLRLLRA
jgi:thiamine biosynthesis lipoprotein